MGARRGSMDYRRLRVEEPGREGRGLQIVQPQFEILSDPDDPTDAKDPAQVFTALSQRMTQQAQQRNVSMDVDEVNSLVNERRGIAIPVSVNGHTVDAYLAQTPDERAGV